MYALLGVPISTLRWQLSVPCRSFNRKQCKAEARFLPVTALRSNHSCCLHGRGHSSCAAFTSLQVNVRDRFGCARTGPLSSSSLDLRCQADGGEEGELQKQEDEENRSGAQTAVWILYGGYILWLLLLPYAPGDPAWATKPETVEELLACSFNFFYFIPALSALLPDYVQSPVVHPTVEALFNIVNAWSIMFGPLLIADQRSDRVSPPVVLLWLGQVFLTNIFLIPYLALRLGAPRDPSRPPDESTHEDGGVWTAWRRNIVGQAKGLGVVCGAVGVISLAWFCLGRAEGGEFGGWSERCQFFAASVGGNRVTYAFVCDLVLYAIVQAWLIGENTREGEGVSSGVVRALRFVPFLGLVAYLVGWPIARHDDDERGL